MKGTALLLLCALALSHGEQIQLTVTGRACHCNPSEAANVCSQSGSESSMVAHENCNQFYRCVNGVPHEFFCPNGLLYDPLAERCDWPHNVDCGDRPIVEQEQSSNEDNNVSVEEVEVVCNDDPAQAASICATTTGNAWIAHENCNQYYFCNHGAPMTLNCSTGLVYDPCRRLCDFPHNVDCGNRPIIDIEHGTTDPESEEEITCDHDNPAEAPSICAADNSEGILIAHEHCAQFYQCNFGQPLVVSCPSNLFYNPCTKTCDWPEHVDCGDRIIETPCNCSGENNEEDCDEESNNENENTGGSETDGNDNNGSGENEDGGSDNGGSEDGGSDNGGSEDGGSDNGGSEDGGSEDGGSDNGGSEDGGSDNGGSEDGGSGGSGGTCNCNPGEAPAICAADGSEGVLIAHENCNQFYKCHNGINVAMFCPSGLLYNAHTEQCDWPENVDCDGKPIVDIDNGSQEGENEDGGSDNGGSEDGGSGGSGGTCNCNPGEAPAICAADGSEGVLIAHENCNQFYKCHNGVNVAMFCPSGLLYNAHTEQCDWPENVDCDGKPIVDVDSGSQEGENEDGGSDNGGSEDGGSGGSGGTCNCNPGEAPAICAADGSEGVLIAHENCNQFYKCHNGINVAMFCPSGLLYNAHTEQCDWPENVDCDGKPIVDIDNGSQEGENEDGGSDNGGSEDGGSGGSGGTCNCNPGEAPAICAADGSEGVLIAHENCNQFYKCHNGVNVAMFCPSGLLYNAHTEQCDWPENVDCDGKPIVDIDNGSQEGENEDGGSEDGGSGGSGGTCNCNPGEAPAICAADGSDGVLIAHENCNQFYKCHNGVNVALFCPSGLLYNAHTEQCDWPDNVDCDGKPIVEVDNGGDEDCSQEDGNENGGSEDGGSGGSGGTCNCNPGEAPAICAADGSEGVLIAHENCNQFYKCHNGVNIAMFCPSGLLYNAHTEQCDWPENVNCDGKPIVDVDSGSQEGENEDGGSDNGGSEDGGSGGSGGTCNCNPGEAPAICAADGSEGFLIAHENCNQFYKCSNGINVALFCPSGLLYDPHSQICDWPQNVDCGERNQNDINDSNNGQETDETDSASVVCDVDGVVLTHENCNQFYRCINGALVTYSCPAGLVYNPAIECCDWPYNTDCGNKPITNVETDKSSEDTSCNCNPSEAANICSAENSFGTHIAHENCNEYYKCVNGIPETFTCPAGLLYNPHLENCDWPFNVVCGDKTSEETGNTDSEDCDEENNNESSCNCNPSEAPSICASSNSDGYLIAHENCNQFYKCSNNVPVPFFCDADLVYNPHTERCDWPYNVDCGDRPIVEVIIDNNDNDTDSEAVEDKPCNCNPAEAPAICATGDSEGVLIAHENCNKFYKCSFGVPVAFTCSNSLLYNPVKEACDWPESVDCGNRPISESSEETNESESEAENETTETNCDPSQAPAICANSGSDGILVAHENCNQFYVCSEGLPVALSCPNNLLYNSLIEQCDWPYNVECGDRVKPETDTDNGSGECACNAKMASSICSSSESNGRLVAHENCNQYYICFQGKPVAKTCPAGLFYDPRRETCNWLSQVDCTDRTVSSYLSLNKHFSARRGVV